MVTPLAPYKITQKDINLWAISQTKQPVRQKVQAPVKSSKLSFVDFAQRIKTKYPEYKDLADLDLTERMIQVYPQYKDQVELPERFRGAEILAGISRAWAGFVPKTVWGIAKFIWKQWVAPWMNIQTPQTEAITKFGEKATEAGQQAEDFVRKWYSELWVQQNTAFRKGGQLWTNIALSVAWWPKWPSFPWFSAGAKHLAKYVAWRWLIGASEEMRYNLGTEWQVLSDKRPYDMAIWTTAEVVVPMLPSIAKWLYKWAKELPSMIKWSQQTVSEIPWAIWTWLKGVKNKVAEWLTSSYLKNPAMREKYMSKVWQAPEVTLLEAGIKWSLPDQVKQISKLSSDSRNQARQSAQNIQETIYSPEWSWITKKMIEWVDTTIPWIDKKMQPILEMSKRFEEWKATAQDLIDAKTFLSRYESIYDDFGRVKKTGDLYEKEALADMYTVMKNQLEDLWTKYGVDFKEINRNTMKYEWLRDIATRAASREAGRDVLSLTDYIMWWYGITADPVTWMWALITKKALESPYIWSNVANFLYTKSKNALSPLSSSNVPSGNILSMAWQKWLKATQQALPAPKATVIPLEWLPQVKQPIAPVPRTRQVLETWMENVKQPTTVQPWKSLPTKTEAPLAQSTTKETQKLPVAKKTPLVKATDSKNISPKVKKPLIKAQVESKVDDALLDFSKPMKSDDIHKLEKLQYSGDEWFQKVIDEFNINLKESNVIDNILMESEKSTKILADIMTNPKWFKIDNYKLKTLIEKFNKTQNSTSLKGEIDDFIAQVYKDNWITDDLAEKYYYGSVNDSKKIMNDLRGKVDDALLTAWKMEEKYIPWQDISDFTYDRYKKAVLSELPSADERDIKRMYQTLVDDGTIKSTELPQKAKSLESDFTSSIKKAKAEGKTFEEFLESKEKLYHWTNADFEDFDVSKAGKTFNNSEWWIFFTKDKELATAFSDLLEWWNKRTIGAYVDTSNSLVYDVKNQPLANIDSNNIINNAKKEWKTAVVFKNIKWSDTYKTDYVVALDNNAIKTEKQLRTERDKLDQPTTSALWKTTTELPQKAKSLEPSDLTTSIKKAKAEGESFDEFAEKRTKSILNDPQYRYKEYTNPNQKEISELKGKLSSLRQKENVLTSDEAIIKNRSEINRLESEISKMSDNSINATNNTNKESFWFYLLKDWEKYYPIEEIWKTTKWWTTYKAIWIDWKEKAIDVEPYIHLPWASKTVLDIANPVQVIRDHTTSELSIDWVKKYVSEIADTKKQRDQPTTQALWKTLPQKATPLAKLDNELMVEAKKYKNADDFHNAMSKYIENYDLPFWDLNPLWDKLSKQVVDMFWEEKPWVIWEKIGVIWLDLDFYKKQFRKIREEANATSTSALWKPVKKAPLPMKADEWLVAEARKYKSAEEMRKSNIGNEVVLDWKPFVRIDGIREWNKIYVYDIDADQYITANWWEFLNNLRNRGWVTIKNNNEIKRVAEAQKVTLADAQKQAVSNLYWYEKSLWNLQAGRTASILNKKIQSSWKVMTKKDWIMSKILDDGLEARDWILWKNNENWNFVWNVINKTEQDFADYVSKNKSELRKKREQKK
jgi:hypothetical protein